jgi:hypothetical protein
MSTEWWSENLKGRNHSEDQDVDRKMILEWILGKSLGKLWIELFCLMIGTSSGILLTVY